MRIIDNRPALENYRYKSRVTMNYKALDDYIRRLYLRSIQPETAQLMAKEKYPHAQWSDIKTATRKYYGYRSNSY